MRQWQRKQEERQWEREHEREEREFRLKQFIHLHTNFRQIKHNEFFLRGNNQNHDGQQSPGNFLCNYPQNVNDLNNVSRFEKPKFHDQNFNSNNQQTSLHTTASQAARTEDTI